MWLVNTFPLQKVIHWLCNSNKQLQSTKKIHWRPIKTWIKVEAVLFLFTTTHLLNTWRKLWMRKTNITQKQKHTFTQLKWTFSTLMYVRGRRCEILCLSMGEFAGMVIYTCYSFHRLGVISLPLLYFCCIFQVLLHMWQQKATGHSCKATSKSGYLKFQNSR